MDPLAGLFDRFRERGDVGALGEVFDRTAPRLLALALHLCGDPAEAEDQLQQTFLQAMRQAAAFDRTRPLEPWLAGLLANSVRNGRRRGERRRTEALPELSSGDEGPLAAAERSELVAMLRTRVGELPQEQRQALMLQLQHGLSPAEIAEVLEVPPGTVRMRLHRGLQALRKLLPAGLAVWLCGSLPQRGLAVVRQAVVQAGKEQAVAAGLLASTATVVAGVLAMKKLLVAIVAVLLVGTAWWWSGIPRSMERPSSSVAPSPADPLVAEVVDGSAHAGPDTDEAAADGRVEVATAGVLRVRVVAQLAGGIGGAGTSADELPVGGAVLQVWPGDKAWIPFDDTLTVVETDANGTVELEDLAPGSWQVLLAADPDEEPRLVLLEPGKQALLEIVRLAVRFVRGVVVDPDGVPVAGAELWLHRGTYMGRYDLPDPPYLGERRAGVSGMDGQFAIAVGAMEGRIGARKPGFAPSFGHYTGGSGIHELRLALGREFATVAGTVRDAAGEPVANALVRVTPAGQDARRAADGTLLAARVGQHVRTDAQGRFTFDGLPPGTQKLWTSAEPRYPTWRDVEVAAFEHADVELKLSDGVTVVGTVRLADGSPARGLGVAARPTLDPNGHFIETGTRADGSYQLPRVPVRDFFVTVSGRGRREFVTYRKFEAPTPGVLRCDFELQDLCALRGRVADSTGQPLAGWQVQAIDEADEAYHVWGRSDAEGRFELLVAKGRTLQVVVNAPDGDPAHPAVERRGVMLGGEPIELRVLAGAKPSAVVQGRLVDPAGAGLPQRRVTLRGTGQKSYSTDMSVLTAADGTFRLGPSSGGELELLLGTRDSPVGQLAKFELASGRQLDLGDLVVEPPAVLRVEVTRADGSPWQGALPGIRLSDPSGGSIVSEQSHEEGAILVKTAAGRRRVQIQGADLIAAPHEVDLEAGQTRTLRFAVAIGRSRELVFNGDGKDHPERRTPLHVVVRGADGEVVVQQDVLTLMPDLRGFRYWYLNHVYPLGRYEVEAHTDAGRRYRATFDVRDSLDDPTRVDVPLEQ